MFRCALGSLLCFFLRRQALLTSVGAAGVGANLFAIARGRIGEGDQQRGITCCGGVVLSMDGRFEGASSNLQREVLTMQVEYQETRLQMFPKRVFRSVVVSYRGWKIFSVYERVLPPVRWVFRVHVDEFFPLGFCEDCGAWFYGAERCRCGG